MTNRNEVEFGEAKSRKAGSEVKGLEDNFQKLVFGLRSPDL